MIKPKVNQKSDLINYWNSFNDGGKPIECASFYGEKPEDPYKEFSNFFKHESFTFELPVNV
jgi:hypothetical protein